MLKIKIMLTKFLIKWKNYLLLILAFRKIVNKIEYGYLVSDKTVATNREGLFPLKK